METRAIARYMRVSPRKAREMVDLVRGEDVESALDILRLTPKRSAGIVAKVVSSAAANAEKNLHLRIDDLYISRAYVDEGPTLKRYRARALGRASRIRKRTSHITIVVGQREEA